MPVEETSLRDLEIELLAPLIRPGARLLELGGGTGWQASRFAQRGIDVVSVDLPGRDRAAVHHPVIEYDGVQLPFHDDAFDVIFSSSVLEHVTDLPGLLAETARVARPGALAIHVMPTPTWRLATSVVHPLAAVRSLVGRGAPSEGAPGPTSVGTRRPLLARALTAGPHGEASSAWAELSLWRSPRWTERLTAGGRFVLRRTVPMGVFYTGHGLVPSLDLAWRRRLARVFGSSTRAFVLARVRLQEPTSWVGSRSPTASAPCRDQPGGMDGPVASRH